MGAITRAVFKIGTAPAMRFSSLCESAAILSVQSHLVFAMPHRLVKVSGPSALAPLSREMSQLRPGPDLAGADDGRIRGIGLEPGRAGVKSNPSGLRFSCNSRERGMGWGVHGGERRNSGWLRSPSIWTRDRTDVDNLVSYHIRT